MFKNLTQKNKGFTLIEMLVSVGLFSIVVTIAMGSILTILDANRKSQSLTLIMNNLNFAIESMTRDIKTADPNSTISNALNDSDSNKTLTLTNSSDKKVVYSYDDTSDPIITKSVDGATAQSILSNDVVIEEFFVDVVNNGIKSQPKVFLYIHGYAQVTEKTRSDFTIQTTVSPRSLNIN